MVKKFTIAYIPVYHYCSVSSLLSILSTSSIFLSHSQYLNDHMESKWIRDIINKCKNQIGTRFDSYYINRIRRIISNYRGEAYLGCFSSSKDTLSQWRAYADDGYGVSIGFDFNLIREQLRSTLNYREVSYHEDSQKYEVTNILEKFIPYEKFSSLELSISELKRKMRLDYYHPSGKGDWGEIRNNSSLKLSDILVDKKFEHESTNQLSQCVREIIILSHFLKNSTFCEENEYRLCYFPNSSLENKNLGKIYLSELKHRCSNKKIIPYYDFNFRDCKGMIKEIVLGPRCQTDEYATRSVLKKFEYKNIRITRSKASYR